MFLPRKRKGASFLIMVVIMALVMSIFAISVTQLSRSRSATLISDATEKQVLYLAEDAANQMILRLNSGSTAPIGLTPATELGANYKYEASYDSGSKPFYPSSSSGTVAGRAYLMDPNYNLDPSRAIYSKTVYLEVASASASPLMVYFKLSGGTRNTPYYRIWDGANWGLELSAPALQSGIYNGTNVDVQHVVLAFEPGSNRAMLGAVDSMGNVWAEAWNGDVWAGPYLVINAGDTSARHYPTRSFDVVYETTETAGSKRAILVGADPRNSVHRPLYSIWNGATWSTPTTIAAAPTTGEVVYVKAKANPSAGSREIAVIYQDDHPDVFAEVWNGTSWSNMGTSTNWGSVSNQRGRAIGIAYEQVSGTAIFAHGLRSSGNWRVYYRTWNGTTLSGDTQVNGTNSTTVRQLEMCPVPGTDQVILAYMMSSGTSGTVRTHTWSGTAWGTAETQGVAYSLSFQYFDLTSIGANNATLFVSTSTSTLLRRVWNGTSWSTGSTTTGWTVSYPTAAALPNLGITLAVFYEDVADNDILEWHTSSSGAWQPLASLAVGVSISPAYERTAIGTPYASTGSGFAGVKGTWRESY
jgi:hypothetical protein